MADEPGQGVSAGRAGVMGGQFLAQNCKSIRRPTALLLALFFLADKARADCTAEAEAAEAAFKRNGSFHYEQRRKFGAQSLPNMDGTRSDILLCGRIDPTRAEEQFNCPGDTSFRRHTLMIGKQSWSRDELGWKGPYRTDWSHSFAMPTDDIWLKPKLFETTCTDRDGSDGRRLRHIERKYQFNSSTVESEIIVLNPQSKLPVRLEHRDLKSGFEVVTNYRFDRTISLRPPETDANARRRSAEAVFAAAKISGPSACRARLIGAIRKSVGNPFSFAYIDARFVPPSYLRGTYVSSQSIQYRHIQHGYTTVTTDVTFVSGKSWSRTDDGLWVAQANVMDSGGLANILLLNDSTIGNVVCKGTAATIQFSKFEHREGELRNTGLRTAHIDDNGRITKIEMKGLQNGVGSVIETREYDPTLKVSRPE
jgi:hypothetical protein